MADDKDTIIDRVKYNYLSITDNKSNFSLFTF